MQFMAHALYFSCMYLYTCIYIKAYYLFHRNMISSLNSPFSLEKENIYIFLIFQADAVFYFVYN